MFNLSQEALQFFADNGFVIIRSFFNPEKLSETKTAMDRYITEVVPSLPDSDAFYIDKSDAGTLKQLQRIEAKFSDIDDQQVADIRKRLPKIVINGLSGDALTQNKREDEAEKPLTPDQLAVGKQVPEIVGEDIDGEQMKLSDFRGKVVLIDFYGFWCPPCVAEIPKLRKLADEMKARSFVLLGVNSDGNRKDLPARIEKERMTWRSWWDGSGGPIARRWNIRAWPTTYVIDHKGIIRHVNLRGDPLSKAVQKLVDEVDAEKKRKKK